MTFIPRPTYNRRIVQCAAENFGVSSSDILGPTRVRKVARARFAVMYAMREARGYSSSQIGEILGRDHSTVINGWQRVERDPDLLELSDRIARDFMDVPPFSDANFYL